MLGKIEGRRRRGHQRIRWQDGITDTMDINLGKFKEKVRDGGSGMLQSMGPQRGEYYWVTEQLTSGNHYFSTSLTLSD